MGPRRHRGVGRSGCLVTSFVRPTGTTGSPAPHPPLSAPPTAELLPYWQSQWPGWSEQDLEEMREQFAAMDLNGDGTVDAEELYVARREALRLRC